MTSPRVVSVPRIHQLSLRVARRVALVVGIASAGVVGIGQGPGWGLAAGVFLAAVSGVAAYLTVERQVAVRLEIGRRTLREARKGRFDALATLPMESRSDELDALIHQVGRAGRALQNEIERLERAESYRRDFLGDVSHELRTPIFAVAGFAETLLDGALDDDRVRRRFVRKIYQNAQRLDALTSDLSDISKLETGRLRIDSSPFDLRELAQEVVEGLERVSETHGVKLAVHIADSVPPVLGDRARVRQVLSNLVENAVTYNETGGNVEVTARQRDGSEVRISVVDDGIGIPKDSIPRLTDRFFRVDKSRSRARGGTGLGLAIVKHILEAHGRRLDIESQVGYGSTFAFSLPAAPVSDGSSGLAELRINVGR
ncbi:MAG: ATP-binding protein [Bacteroidota bacterium]